MHLGKGGSSRNLHFGLQAACVSALDALEHDRQTLVSKTAAILSLQTSTWRVSLQCSIGLVAATSCINASTGIVKDTGNRTFCGIPFDPTRGCFSREAGLTARGVLWPLLVDAKTIVCCDHVSMSTVAPSYVSSDYWWPQKHPYGTDR